MSDQKRSPLGLALAAERHRRKDQKLILAAADALLAYEGAVKNKRTDATELGKALHASLDRADAADAWGELKYLLGRGEDDALAALVRYSLKRSKGQMKEMVREAQMLPSVLPAREKDRGPDPGPSKTRKRSR